eukprot:NODE_15008_length_1073_cov_3.269556.p7 GENE.NODE_15008_length_1073_cov_3.269556~~NODE_15008_length_1073_cov_3.269556.p7  ORF type:complete len:67 (+),score=5.03 NODE_15008_length_1073_cov_3.269556:242-442(+)
MQLARSSLRTQRLLLALCECLRKHSRISRQGFRSALHGRGEDPHCTNLSTDAPLGAADGKSGCPSK